MKKIILSAKRGLVFLLATAMVLIFLPAIQAKTEQGTARKEEASAMPQARRQMQQMERAGMPGLSSQEPGGPEYVPGELIVKLKEGKTLADLRALNDKYQVGSTEKVFPDTPQPEDTLKALKNKLAGLGTSEHDKWYWQLDKNSQEYKDYAAKLEKEKAQLQGQIKAQEELIARLAERQKRAPEGAKPPSLSNIYVLKAPAEANIKEMAQEYSANPAVEYAEPNGICHLNNVLPNDPYVKSQQDDDWAKGLFLGYFPKPNMWGLDMIKMKEAWKFLGGYAGAGKYLEPGTTNSFKSVVVAVVDTGIDYTHPDIRDNIWVNTAESPNNGKDDDQDGYIDDYYGFDFTNSIDADGDGNYNGPNDCNDSDPMDDQGHGTHVAGTIAAVADNGIGIAGVAPGAKVMAIKCFDAGGYGNDVAVSRGIRYAVAHKADVINCSFGGGYSNLEADAIKDAYLHNVVVVAAAGNDYSDVKLFYPANDSRVITVAALAGYQWLASFSNWGSKIDVAAPGDFILSLKTLHPALQQMSLTGMFTDINYNAIDQERYVLLSGTSMAAPHVAGQAAIIIAHRLNKNQPGLTPDEVKNIICNSAQPELYGGRWNPYSGFGMIDVAKGLQEMNTTPVTQARIFYPVRVFTQAKNFTVYGNIPEANFQSFEIRCHFLESDDPERVELSKWGYIDPAKQGYSDFCFPPENIRLRDNGLKAVSGELAKISLPQAVVDRGGVGSDLWRQNQGGIYSGITSLYLELIVHHKTGDPTIVTSWFPFSLNLKTGWPRFTNLYSIDVLAYYPAESREKSRLMLNNLLLDSSFKVIKQFPEGIKKVALGEMDILSKQVGIVTETSKGIAVYDDAGNQLWDSQTGHPTEIVLADLDSDGAKEIIVVSDSAKAKDYLRVVNQQRVIAEARGNYNSGQVGQSGFHCAAAADIDGDGEVEIVAGYRGDDLQYYLAIYRYSYGPDNTPFLDRISDIALMPGEGRGGNFLGMKIVLADVNKDTKREIIVGFSPSDYAYRYAIFSDGKKIFAVDYPGYRFTGYNLLVADVNRDDTPEIFMANKIYYKSGDTWEGKTIDCYGIFPELAANLDTDLELELVGNNEYATYVVKSTGQLINFYPWPGRVVVDDFDSDELNEVLYGDRGPEGDGLPYRSAGLYLFETYGKYDLQGTWLQKDHDSLNSNIYNPEPALIMMRPTSLRVIAISDKQFSLSWSYRFSNIDGFKVERSDSSGVFRQIATVGKNLRSYIDTVSTTATLYYYRVRAYSEGKNLPYSKQVSTKRYVSPPQPPTNLQATTGANYEVILTWTDNSDNETSFEIERSRKPNSEFVKINSAGQNITQWFDAKGTSRSLYYYRVRARNAAGVSPYSNVVSHLPPRDPRLSLGRSRYNNDGTISLHLDLRATGNVLGFKIERRKPGEDFKEIARDVVYSEYRDRCPTLDEYVYRIRAYNAAGLSGYSEEVSFTKEQWPPKSPTGLTATQRRDGTIILNWEDNSDNETGFSIERDFIEVDTVSENTNTWTDQSPINRPTRYGTTWYMVKAVKEDNGTIISESAYSDVRLKK